MTIELKTCPFCGGECAVDKLGGGWSVECVSPTCEVRPYGARMLPSREEAITAWNRRADYE